MENREPVLYILMRKDIPDLNPGKAMAQACHAQSSFLVHYYDAKKTTYPCQDYIQACETWIYQVDSVITRHTNNRISERNAFGTTIVLEVTEKEVEDLAFELTPPYCLARVFSVTDPSYPFRNHYGELHTMPLVTCYYVFAYKPDHFEALSKLPLHR